MRWLALLLALAACDAAPTERKRPLSTDEQRAALLRRCVILDLRLALMYFRDGPTPTEHDLEAAPRCDAVVDPRPTAERDDRLGIWGDTLAEIAQTRPASRMMLWSFRDRFSAQVQPAAPTIAAIFHLDRANDELSKQLRALMGMVDPATTDAHDAGQIAETIDRFATAWVRP